MESQGESLRGNRGAGMGGRGLQNGYGGQTSDGELTSNKKIWTDIIHN